jgi:RNA 2',3'-cyclic 3'-phosphodiesterase
MRRVFIAINLPHKIKQRLIELQEEWSELPIRWAGEKNLHLTLIFIGNLSDQETGDICQNLKKIEDNFSPFLINLTQISYGPQHKDVPRLVWVKGGKCEPLSFLKKEIDNILKESIRFQPDQREFLPHITLGRVKKWQWKNIDPEERPEINKNISFQFEVNSIEIMESKLKRSGAEHIELGSISLKK